MSTGAIAPVTSAVPDPGQDARLKKACAQLEAVFMNELAKALRETVPQDGAMPNSTGGDMFAAMLDEKLAEIASTRMQRGIAAALYRELKSGS